MTEPTLLRLWLCSPVGTPDMATVVLAYTEEEAMDKLTRIPQYRELPPTAKVRAIDITSTYFSQGYDIQIHQSKGVYH